MNSMFIPIIQEVSERKRQVKKPRIEMVIQREV